jgi:hypothetical protein
VGNSEQLRDERGRWAAGMIDRLHKTLDAKGVPNPRAEAVTHLQNSGVLHPGTETLTTLGVMRTKMGPIERAKDRGARALGRDRSEMKYDHATGKVQVK